jgi:hypothetical protein
MKATSGLRLRRLAEVVPQRMSEEPVVILTGPRTVGKSTLLAALAAEFDRPVEDPAWSTSRSAGPAAVCTSSVTGGVVHVPLFGTLSGYLTSGPDR